MAAKANNLELISEVIGPDLALCLARNAKFYGRQRWVYVPCHASPRHRVTRVIGFEAANSLSRAMGGCLLTVGAPDRFEKKLRLSGQAAAPMCGPINDNHNAGLNAPHKARRERRPRQAAPAWHQLTMPFLDPGVEHA